MMKTLIATPVFTALVYSASAFAGGAGLLPEAPHGGVVQESSRLNMELVMEGSEIRLYPLSKMGQSVPANQVQVTASSKAPRKKRQPLQLTPADDHYIGRIEAKTAGKLELKVKAAAKGEEVSFTFEIPPRN